MLGSAVSAGGQLKIRCDTGTLRIEYASSGDNGWPSRADVPDAPDAQLCSALFDIYLGASPCAAMIRPVRGPVSPVRWVSRATRLTARQRSLLAVLSKLGRVIVGR